jgi:fluoride exporter
MMVLLLALSGGFGAGARFVLDGLLRSRTSGPFPLGTFVVNVSGSLLLGLLAGSVISHDVRPEFQLVLGTGFLGGYTTFSTASVEAVRLIQDRRAGLALLYAAGTMMATVAAAAAGLTLVLM